MTKKYFTLEEANSLVPWLNSAFVSIRELMYMIEQMNPRILDKSLHIKSNGNSSTESSLAELNQKKSQLEKQIEEIVNSIFRKGIHVKRIEDGLVDFPAISANREIYLCWIFGESRVEFWHEKDAGFSGRQPV